MKNLCRGLTADQIQHHLTESSVLYPEITSSCMVKGYGPAYSTSTAFVLHASMFCSTQ